MEAVERVRILIVEDEALVAEDLRMRLLRMGYEVVGIVDRGEDVLAATVEATPDLVLMDIKLKGQSTGIDAGRRLRNLQQVPFVFVTSFADKATLGLACAAEPFGYVLKPFDERALQAAIEMALHRSRVEQRLRAMERRMRTILTNIGDAVVVTDVDQRINFMNVAGEQLSRWPIGAALGESFERVFPLERGSDGAALPSPAAAAVLTNAAVRVEDGAVLVTRDGRRVPIDDTASPLREGRNGVSGAVVILRDCSERAQMIAERRHVERQLQEAQQFESLGRVAGGLAHDFNNLLTAIIGNAELLLRELERRPQEQQMAHAIEASARAAARICERLRDCAAGTAVVRQPVDLRAMVEETIEVARVLFGPGVRVRFEPAALPCPLADRGQLQQVLLNLLVNAGEAIGDAAGEIVLRLGVTGETKAGAGGLSAPLQLPAGDYAFLEVVDSGAGISADVLPRVFDPFFTTKRQGRGLGLASVLGIVRSHGGGMRVDSHAGQGARFTVLLPLSAAPCADIAAASPASPHPSGRTVLVVDDDPLLRSLVARLCAKNGVQSVEAAGGDAALGVLRQDGDRFAAALLDVNMPGMDGIELARRLQLAWPGIRVALISGSRTLAPDALPGAMLLRKPFTSAEFLTVLRSLVPQLLTN